MRCRIEEHMNPSTTVRSIEPDRAFLVSTKLEPRYKCGPFVKLNLHVGNAPFSPNDKIKLSIGSALAAMGYGHVACFDLSTNEICAVDADAYAWPLKYDSLVFEEVSS